MFIEFIISGNTSYTYWLVFISPLDNKNKSFTEMQLTVGPVGPRPGGRILEGPANDVFVSDLMTGKYFYCLGLSKIKFLSVLVTS